MNSQWTGADPDLLAENMNKYDAFLPNAATDATATPRLTYAVVDSGPLIKGLRLETLAADNLVTVPEVLRELRDRQARQMLASLPVELQTREPSGEALAAIKAFARQTGDLAALSVVDQRVLALAWMLEKECKGGVGHLRSSPAPPGANSARRRPDSEPAAEAAVEAAAVEAAVEAKDTAEAELAAVAVAARAAASAAAAEDDDEEEEDVEELFDDAPCALLPYLYVGSVDAAANLPALYALKISHVLTVATELPNVDAIAAAAASRPGSSSAADDAAATPPPSPGQSPTRLYVPMAEGVGTDLAASAALLPARCCCRRRIHASASAKPRAPRSRVRARCTRRMAPSH